MKNLIEQTIDLLINISAEDGNGKSYRMSTFSNELPLNIVKSLRVGKTKGQLIQDVRVVKDAETDSMMLAGTEVIMLDNNPTDNRMFCQAIEGQSEDCCAWVPYTALHFLSE